MATTRLESKRNLVNIQSAAFIRAITLTLTLKNSRPNTPMRVYFDGIDVTHFCYPSTGQLGDTIVSNSFGEVTILFRVPGGKFTTGDKTIIVSDAPTFSAISITGSTYGSASAKFKSTGVEKLYQTTTKIVTSTTVVIERVLPPPQPNDGGGSGDPLAQSFFTYGVKGGCFVTSIDLYFYSKDDYIPVTVDIRPMVNGYPTSASAMEHMYSVSLSPSDINISSNGTVATNFKFDVPVYLEEDKDYCFVVFSNSKSYNLFTSKMGEVSFETGRTIFDQPYVGSLFRSENNITWQAEQFEDIKFKLNIAQFSTGTNAIVKFNASPDYFAVSGSRLSTVLNSSEVTVKQTTHHGLEVNSLVEIYGDTGAVYNGIPNTDLSGPRTVSEIVDEFTYKFNAAQNATSTGPILTGGQVVEIQVDAGGSSYVSTPTVVITGGGGTGASAVAYVSNGEVVRISVVDGGSGYTSAPTVTFSGGGGTGAVATSVIEAVFSILTNKPVNFVVNNIPHVAPSDTKISAKISSTQLNYSGGNLNSYQPSDTVDFVLSGTTELTYNSVIATKGNEVAKMGGNKSMLVEYTMSTTNKNVSPFIDYRNQPSVIAYTNRINNQSNEDVESISNSELSATDGSAHSRYLTKKFTLETPSKGINLFSEIYSTVDTRVDWYIRTSISGSGVSHSTLGWKKLKCDVTVNKSTKPGEVFDYKFYLYDLSEFDTYDLKCVLRTTNPAHTPSVKNYRAIIVA